MKFISTRLQAQELSFQEVVFQGLGSDGGLYIPEFLPKFSKSELTNLAKMNYQELFFEVTKAFIGDEISEEDYQKIIAKSYQNFSHSAIAPIKQIKQNEFILELFHGPTLAFKDFALQFLGNLLDHLLKKSSQEIVIIGATSGDTGSAAIQGCMKCENAKIFILYPDQKVSDVQRKQMTTIDSENVFNIAVKGNFDDCQAMVKKMFVEQDFLKGKKMVAINSINFARVMAQIVYYFYSALAISANEENKISYSVPTGNFGDIYAAFLAKEMGLPIDKLIIATNSNDILHRFIQKNDYSKSQMVETISPSMNIQISSNFERLLFHYYQKFNKADQVLALMQNFEKSGKMIIDEEIFSDIKKTFLSFSCDDKQTKQIIKNIFTETSEIIDPHTAIGVAAAKEFLAIEENKTKKVISLATASPAKFPEAVFSAIEKKPQLPNFLADLFSLPEKSQLMENSLSEVKKFISDKI
jgi:threonine synthase